MIRFGSRVDSSHLPEGARPIIAEGQDRDRG